MLILYSLPTDVRAALAADNASMKVFPPAMVSQLLGHEPGVCPFSSATV